MDKPTEYMSSISIAHNTTKTGSYYISRTYISSRPNIQLHTVQLYQEIRDKAREPNSTNDRRHTEEYNGLRPPSDIQNMKPIIEQNVQA